MKFVCFVLGVGVGIGGIIGQKFVCEGYYLVLCCCSDGEGFECMVDGICYEGGEVLGFFLNVVKENVIEEIIVCVEEEIGLIEIFIYNFGVQIGNCVLVDISYKVFEFGWCMVIFGVFCVVLVLLLCMVEWGQGIFLVMLVIVVVWGNVGQYFYVVVMGGCCMFCQMLNVEFGLQGVYVVYVFIDGVVDVFDILGKMFGVECFEQFCSMMGVVDGLIKLEYVVEIYFYLVCQY